MDTAEKITSAEEHASRRNTYRSPGVPLKAFFFTGATQVLAKAMTQKALIYNVRRRAGLGLASARVKTDAQVPFFVSTLVKNAKMVPVMLGAIAISGAREARRGSRKRNVLGAVEEEPRAHASVKKRRLESNAARLRRLHPSPLRVSLRHCTARARGIAAKLRVMQHYM